MALVQLVLDGAAVTGSAFGTNGGVQTIVCYGTWDGATVTLEVTPDAGTTWVVVDSTNGVLTANGAFNFEAAAGFSYRLAISSAGGSTSISAKVAD